MAEDRTPEKQSRLGKISLWLAIGPWFAYLLWIACAMVGAPGFG